MPSKISVLNATFISFIVKLPAASRKLQAASCQLPAANCQPTASASS